MLFNLPHHLLYPHAVPLQFGVAFGYFLWAMASSFAVFVLARAVGGLSKGNVGLSYSIMTDILDERARATGMVSAKFINLSKTFLSTYKPFKNLSFDL